MRISEHWLREWVNPPVTTAELAERLTMAGLEVDSVEPAAPPFEGVVVGRVLTVEPHPDADKLRVCTVDVGGETPLNIVCGAPNVREGMRAPTAVVGARLPGGMKIRKAKLRGVPSEGMLCSARELGLSEEQSGLMELPEDAPVGEDLRCWLDLDDAVIEVDLTPNRGDCLGMAGVAREVSALTGTDAHPPVVEVVEPAIEETFPIEVAAPADCPRYCGRVIRGLDPRATTPLWMQERLRRGGIRSLGPLVDVTNYVMLELGQPMHAFDLARLQGGICVRRATAGEKITLLDGREVELDDDVLLIADRQGPLAMAGVMGGEHSGVGETTTDILLESAFFTPTTIAGRARRYGMQTDSSFRFERGVDPELQRRATERATALLLEIAGGRPGPVVEVVSEAHLPAPRSVLLRRTRLEMILGVAIDDQEVDGILRRLGMAVEPVAEGWRVTAPPFRFDIAIEVDLIEEIGRIHGYDRLPSREPRGRMAMAPVSEARLPHARLRGLLVDRGWQEVITYSFVEEEWQRRLLPERQPLALANPISADMGVMRLSLWPGLLRTVAWNRNRQQDRVRIFETGLCFVPEEGEVAQIARIGGAWSGARYPEQWGLGSEAADFFDIKGDVEALLALGGHLGEARFEAAEHPALHPGQSARVLIGGRPAGWLGMLHPSLQASLETGPVLLFELDLAPLEEARIARYRSLSHYPAIRRDLAVVVSEETPAEAVLESVREACGEWLVELRLFDDYRGQGIESGQKSLALGLILQDSSRTLTDSDVDGLMERIVSGLGEQFGATLRD